MPKNPMCPHCRATVMKEAINENGGKSPFFWKCPECGSFYNSYKPLPHQESFHSDSHVYKGYFGGFGAGKTLSSVMEIIKHVITIENGETLMGACTMNQLEQTSMKMFKDIIPKDLIAYRSAQKNYIDFWNGHRVMFRPLDDEGKARSLNLTGIHVEEASEVNFAYFVQLKARLRNEKAITYVLDENGDYKLDFEGKKIVEEDNRLFIVSSNPDIGWIRSEFLLRSKITQYYGVEYNYYVPEKDLAGSYHSHVVPTKGNIHLPPTFYEEQSAGKPAWWIKRYLEASFEYSEGMVFPNFMENVIEPFPIPKNWYRMIAVDFGRRDPTVFLYGAIDPKDGTLYVYDEYYESEQPANVFCQEYNARFREIPAGTLLRTPVADPTGRNRDQVSGKSWYDIYAEYNIFFRAGHKDVVSGVMKVYTLMSMGRVKIFKICTNTIREGINYKYEPQELEAKKNVSEKPVDKDDHAMSCLRWMCMELYDDFNRLQTTGAHAYSQENPYNQEYLPHALRDYPQEYGNLNDDFAWYGQF